MGIRTKITLNEINQLLKGYDFSFEKLEITIDGISDSTYVVSDSNAVKYIFKIYESANIQKLESEVQLLNSLKGLPTPKFLLSLNNIPMYQDKIIGLFTYLEGTSLQIVPTLNHIGEIGDFLGNFHRQSKEKKSTNPRKFTLNKVSEMFQALEAFDCEKEIKEKFFKCYSFIQNIELKDDGVIHGDLFLDNTKFTDNKLTAVFDFIEACNGSFLFDLSVIVNSWCFNSANIFQRKHFDKLIESYEENFNIKIELTELKKVMLFASLFYALRRFTIKHIQKRKVVVKPYEEYLIKFDIILKEL